MKGKWILLNFFILFLFLSVYNIMLQRDVWLDESFSLLQSGRKLIHPDSMGFTLLSAVDVHPPGYYVVFGFWRFLVGDSIFAARFLSVLFGLGSVAVSYLIIKQLYPDRYKGIFIWFAGIFCLSSSILHYSTEIRMYAMGLFFCLLSFYLLISQDGTLRRCFAFCFVTALLPYIHYYTIFFIMGEVAFTCVFWMKKENNSFVKLFIWGMWAFIVVLTIPLISFFLDQYARISSSWFQKSSWSSILSTYYYAFFHTNQGAKPMDFLLAVLFLVGVFLIAWYGISKQKKQEKKMSAFLFVWFLAVPVLGMMINVFIKGIYHHRFFFFTSWIIMLLLALGLERIFSIKPRDLDMNFNLVLKAFAFLCILIGTILMVYVNLSGYFATQSTELRDIASYLNDHCDGLPVLHESTWSMLPMMIYSNRCHLNFLYFDKSVNNVGLDVVPEALIFRSANVTLADEFYYLESTRALRVNGFSYEVVFITDGLNVTRAMRNG